MQKSSCVLCLFLSFMWITFPISWLLRNAENHSKWYCEPIAIEACNNIGRKIGRLPNAASLSSQISVLPLPLSLFYMGFIFEYRLLRCADYRFELILWTPCNWSLQQHRQINWKDAKYIRLSSVRKKGLCLLSLFLSSIWYSFFDCVMQVIISDWYWDPLATEACNNLGRNTGRFLMKCA